MKKPKPKPPISSASIAVATPTQQKSVTVTTEAWTGPLPPPSDLEAFGDLVENGAERIVRQWEQESDHRRQVEKAEINIWGRNQFLGQTYAFVFVMAALAVTTFAVYEQQLWLAAVFGRVMSLGVV